MNGAMGKPSLLAAAIFFLLAPERAEAGCITCFEEPDCTLELGEEYTCVDMGDYGCCELRTTADAGSPADSGMPAQDAGSMDAAFFDAGEGNVTPDAGRADTGTSTGADSNNPPASARGSTRRSSGCLGCNTVSDRFGGSPLLAAFLIAGLLLRRRR